MTKPPSILHPESEKASYLAHGVLCALGGMVVAGVGWMFWHGVGRTQVAGTEPASPFPTSPTGYALPTPAGNTVLPSQAALLPPAPGVPPASLGVAPAPAPSFLPVQQPPIPTPAALAAQPPPPVANTLPPLSGVPMSAPGVASSSGSSLPDAPRPALPPGRELKNVQAIEAVVAAREIRKMQDMQGALNELRTADLREPNHPEILGEMALTYEMMGIESKAQALWKQIIAMGEAATGGYFTLAKSKVDAAGAGPGPAAATSPVSLGTCQVLRDPTVASGEKITVRVPIIAARGATVDPAQMTIHMFLYESVNNGAYIEQVRGAEPKQDWVSKPVNWQDSPEELLDMVYDLPPPSPEQVRDLGKRQFHGYVVKLFYKDRLVSEQMSPESLRDSTQRNAPSGLDDSLFRK